MANKTETIAALLTHTAGSITQSRESWLAFLTTAAWSYKYPFESKLLIHAQRPEATACAGIEVWNRLGRWVNRGAKGIALLDDTGRHLQYVFDIADTNSRQTVSPVWVLSRQGEQAVEAVLRRAYDIPEGGDLAYAFHFAVNQAVNDGIGQYLPDLQMDGHQAGQDFSMAVKTAVSTMLLTRCGYNPAAFFLPEDYDSALGFHTVEAVSVLGGAVSDIGQNLLRQIESTVKALPIHINEPTERNDDHEPDLHPERRLPDSRPDNGRDTGDHRQIRDAAPFIPQGEPSGAVHLDDRSGQAGQSPIGNRPDSGGAAGTADARADEGGRRDREPQGN